MSLVLVYFGGLACALSAYGIATGPGAWSIFGCFTFGAGVLILALGWKRMQS